MSSQLCRRTRGSSRPFYVALIACAVAAFTSIRPASADPFERVTEDVLEKASADLMRAMNTSGFAWGPEVCSNWNLNWKRENKKAPLPTGAVKYACILKADPDAVFLFQQKPTAEKPKNTQQAINNELQTLFRIQNAGLRIVPTLDMVMDAWRMTEEGETEHVKVWGYIQAAMDFTEFRSFHTIEYLTDERRVKDDLHLMGVDWTDIFRTAAGGAPAIANRTTNFCMDLMAYKNLAESGFVISDEQGAVHKATGLWYFNDPVAVYSLNAPSKEILSPRAWEKYPPEASDLKPERRLKQIMGMTNVWSNVCSRLFM